MGKRYRFVTIIILTLMVLTVILTVNFTKDQKTIALTKDVPEITKPINKQDPIDAEQVLTEIDTDTLSKYSGLHLQNTTKKSSVYNIFTSIPVAESNEINQPIQKWLNEQETEFLIHVEDVHDILSNNELKAELNITVETEFVSENIYTLVFNSYQITYGANGINTIKTFTVDVENNRFIELEDILLLNDELVAKIDSFIKATIINNEEAYRYVFEEHLDKALSSPEKWKWSINESSFTIYFDEYEVAAGAGGVTKFTIPLSEISSYLIDDFTEKLEIKPVNPNEAPIDQIKGEAKHDPDAKYVALTFDDGPSPTVTPRVLETLKAFNARATFFMLGSQVEYYPIIVAQVVQDGHELANHTNNHMDLTKAGVDKIRTEIGVADKRIREASGINQSMYFRPPYGAYNDTVKAVAAEFNSPIILWSVDSLDWKSRNAKMINELILNTVKPNDIILLHDIHPTTADALPELLTKLRDQGYQFVTVSELLAIRNAEGIGPHY